MFPLFINPIRCSFCCFAGNGRTYCRAPRRQFFECAQRLPGARAGYIRATARTVDSRVTDPSCLCGPPRHRTSRHVAVNRTTEVYLVPNKAIQPQKRNARRKLVPARVVGKKPPRVVTGGFRADTSWAGSAPRYRRIDTRRSRSAPRSAPWTASRARRASSSGCPLSRSCRCRWS
jgi:hypothetical protein